MKKSQGILSTFAAIASGSYKIIPQELRIPCCDGTVLGAQYWKRTTSSTKFSTGQELTILCLHGWLDNCRSFHYLAPTLASSLNANVVALDYPGHGESSHRSLDAPPLVQSDLVYYVCEAIDAITDSEVPGLAMHQGPISVIGHSLGAGVASLSTAAFPEKIENLILLDGAGFLARNAKDTASHVRNHVVRRQKQKTQKKPRLYENLDMAIRTRRESATRMPGNQTISYEAAKELVERGTCPCPDDKVRFQHDHRFNWPSIQYMTWEQNEGIFRAIGNEANVRTCIITAEDGWPFDPTHILRVKELINPEVFEMLPGSHYLHADPESADRVAETIINFLKT